MFGKSRKEFRIDIGFAFWSCFEILSHCMTPTGQWRWVMWRQMSQEQKGPFLPKLEDSSGFPLPPPFFFFFLPSSKKSKKTADTDRRRKFYLWWHNVLLKQICFEEDCFLWCVEIKKQWIILEGVLVQILLPSITTTPPLLFLFYFVCLWAP